ncbi:MAG: hypothetical protein HY692_01440 [Cyanobacteria bacterium NC_groundwater_1444_Ag_S-0.65um_54_12]|nr:hypothetical protein [Cyanobacteria bacterium NC_groundwater_1444_Ag_S-0.65um_54_12]
MNWLFIAGVIAAVLAGIIIGMLAVPKTRRMLIARLTKAMADAYQRQLSKQFKAKFPELYERFGKIRLSGDTPNTLQTAMRRIPPQEGIKLQAEFLRLSENFLARHGELGNFISVLKSQDAKGQAKEMQKIFKLPPAQRQAIAKDLLWAYDQIYGRFPRWVKMLEATLHGSVDQAAEQPVARK